jgi:isoquinoline 1-oxidoreductase beta subunit
MTSAPLVSRRDLFAAASLVVAIALPGGARAASTGRGIPKTSQLPGQTLNAFIAIMPDGQITFIPPNAEIGQGIYTSEAQIIAEELECDLARMRIVAAPVDERYNSPILHQQVTVASASTRGFFTPLRLAGAQTRMRLIAAAARKWGVPPGECQAAKGRVMHAASGRGLDYGALASAAAREPVPAADAVQLKPAAQFRIIGHSVPRMDTPDKANGRAIFGIDIVRPGMKFAAADSCPIIGGWLASVDPGPALAIRGVHMVIPLRDSVAVLADNSWAALKGLAALAPNWTGGDPMLDDAVLERQLVTAAHDDKPAFSKAEGDVRGAIDDADPRLEMVYELPFLAHAPMEPLNAVVELTADGCDIWLGTQAPGRVQAAAAKAAGLPPEKVRVWNQLSGGGFGRRGGADYIPMAVMIAQKAGVPVKMIWTREQDMRRSALRPLWRQEMTIGLKGGRINGWHHRIIGGSVIAQSMPQMLKFGPDVNAVDGALELIYDVGPTHLDFVRVDPPLPIIFWRSVGPGHNMFVVEGAVNEAAEKLGVDPVEFRRSMIKDPRARHVLDLAVAKSDWNATRPARTGRGVAVQHAFGGYLACVLEAEVSEFGDIKLRRVTIALDVGQVINPDGVVSQIEGGALFGLSAALWGKITIARGQIVQTNFNAYRMLRINETPKFDVHIVPSDGPPQGVGEAGTSIVFPALAAAIHDATGVRLRRLPFDRHDDLVGGAGQKHEGKSAGLWAAAAIRLAAGAIDSPAAEGSPS